MRNLVTDVPGLLVGHADAMPLASGVTVALIEGGVASGAALGGAAGGRDTGVLEPDALASGVDAIVLAGGSSFGLDAGTGAQGWLRAHGRGAAFAGHRVPLAPVAILFDLANGGDKAWDGPGTPYAALAARACEAARADFALGSVGAGLGATTVDLKGGVGSASARASGGATVGALVAVNAIGSAVMGEGPHFWAAPLEVGAEFGGLGWPAVPMTAPLAWKGRGAAQAETGTTIALVATDATLTKAQLKRLAVAAHGGLARALSVSLAPTDGDTVFAVSTSRAGPPRDVHDFIELCALASTTLARAIARGVFEARALPFPGAPPAWRDRFGR